MRDRDRATARTALVNRGHHSPSLDTLYLLILRLEKSVAVVRGLFSDDCGDHMPVERDQFSCFEGHLASHRGMKPVSVCDARLDANTARH